MSAMFLPFFGAGRWWWWWGELGVIFKVARNYITITQLSHFLVTAAFRGRNFFIFFFAVSVAAVQKQPLAFFWGGREPME